MSDDANGKIYSRRRFVRLAAITAAALPISSSLLAACGDVTPTPAATTAAATPAGSTTAAATSAAATTASATTAGATTAAATTAAAGGTAGYFKSPAPGVPDAYTIPPTPFKATSAVPGSGGTVRVFMISYAAPPPPETDNKYWQELEKRLGVKWEITLAPQNNYAEKLAVITAGGDIPELTFLDTDLGFAPEQIKTIQQGAYTDLTPYLTGDAIKQFPNLALYPDVFWKNVAIKGKIYGVPRPRYLVGSANLYRKDWLENLNMPAPTNSTEFYAMMEAFTKKKPEPTQPNTWGMGFTQGEFSTQTLFMHMFRVPNTWKMDSNGNLSYFIEAPEYKEAIAFMRSLWAAGFIHPDSPSQSKQQSQDNFVAGKYGVWQDSLTGYPGPTGRHATALGINPKANIVPYFPPAKDGGKQSAWLGSGYFGFAAIPSKVGKDPAKAKELLGIINWLASPFGSEEYNFYNFGIDGVDNTVNPDGTRVLNDTGKKEIGDLPKIANGLQVLYYPGFPEQPKILQDVIQQMIAAGVPNPALTAISATWTSKSKELSQLVEDRIVRIIIGIDPIDAIDTLISDWKGRGGTQVAQEFAASLKG